MNTSLCSTVNRCRDVPLSGSIPINICMTGELYADASMYACLRSDLDKDEGIHLASALLSSKATLNFLSTVFIH